jgi:hypothetical protein
LLKGDHVTANNILRLMFQMWGADGGEHKINAVRK